MSAAAESAIGITISAVAMLLISWPSTAVSRNSPRSRACGPASPTTSTSRSASCPAAPVSTMAVESEIMPPTRITVVQAIARYVSSIESTPESTIAPAARSPATAAGTTPVVSRTTMPRRITSARFAPVPSGPAWRRTSSGSSTTSTSGSARCSSSAPHAPRSRSASPAASVDSPASSSPFRWTARTTRSPLSVTMPGNTASPISPERGGITTSATPDPRREQRVRRVLEPVVLDERPGVAAEVARDRPRTALRQQPRPEQHDDQDRPDDERDTDERELEEAEAPDPGVGGVVRDDHVDGRAGEREQRARVRGEGDRHQQLRRRAPEPNGHQDDHGGQRRDGGVDGDERRDEGDDRHRQHDDAGAVVPDAGDQRLADERRHTGRLERLADDEERGDEEDGRVAEARQRLLQVEHARRPQRERGPDRHDRDRESGPRRRRPRRAARTRKVMVDWLIDRCLRPGLRRPASSLQSGRDHEHHHRRDGEDAHQSLCTGAPGPRGMPSRYQATKNRVQMIDSTRTYGSIIATTVPMPASRR